MQRFHLCRSSFSIGGATCDTAISDSRFLVVPGAVVAAANPGGLIGPVIDEISKGVVVGGLRFWLEWALNSDDIPAGFADIVCMASVLWWIAKVPIDPETLQPAWLPDPMILSHQGDRAQRENLLWTKHEFIPIGFNDGTTTTSIIASNGAAAFRSGASTENWFLTPPQSQQRDPYVVKTKRTLSEYDALLFGVTSVTGVADTLPCPIAVDLYGQVALKRTRNVKTGL